MIIRIMGEGQFDVPDDSADALNALDEQVEAAVESGRRQRLLRRVRPAARAGTRHGSRVADDTLLDSDLVLPPADSTVDEVARLLGDEGLIPG